MINVTIPINSKQIWTLLKTLFEEAPLLLVVLSVFTIGVIAVLTPGTFRLIGWLRNRRRKNIAQIREWLDDHPDLGPETRHNLCAKRESLMLLATRGVAANSLVARALVDASEDKTPGGPSWRDIRLSQDYLKLNKDGKLKIRFGVGAWVDAVLSLLLTLSFLLLFAIAFFVSLVPTSGNAPSSADSISLDLTRYAIALSFAIIAIFTAIPLRRVLAARGVNKRLEETQK